MPRPSLTTPIGIRGSTTGTPAVRATNLNSSSEGTRGAAASFPLRTGRGPVNGRISKTRVHHSTTNGGESAARTTNTMKVVTRTRPGSRSKPKVLLMASRSSRRQPLHSASNRNSAAVDDAVVVTINRSHFETDLVPLLQRRQRSNSKSKVTFFVSPDVVVNSLSLVLYNDKFLSKIFRHLNWNELLPARQACKKWLEVISSDSTVKHNLPVVTIRRDVVEAMSLFNKSAVVWTQFKILTSYVCDGSNAAQHEFWSRHGPTIVYLQIRNSTMSLSGLVDVLFRCVNLEHLTIEWTPEMYSFNSELIKKYFGIHFRNGTFSRLREIAIEKSSYMVDNALWSLLKWCGGPLRSLSLTCKPDGPTRLSRLKPRWSIEPIQNYVSRFGYTGQLHFLDFTNSNFNSEDLVALTDTSALSHLTGIRLNSCRVNATALVHFLKKKGQLLEELYLDNVIAANEKIFVNIVLPLLRSLSISGLNSSYDNIDFVMKLHRLEEFFCENTTWCDYSLIASPFQGHPFRHRIKRIDIGNNRKMHETSRRANFIGNSKWFSSFLSNLSNLVHLDAGGWGNFGNNDNFELICTFLNQLRILRLSGWTGLGDAGLTGLSNAELEKEINYTNMGIPYDINISHLSKDKFVGSLQHLQILDISNSHVTNCSIKYGLVHLTNLRQLSIDETFITEMGLQQLIEECVTLDKISMQGCDQMPPIESGKIQRQDGRFVFVGKLQ